MNNMVLSSLSLIDLVNYKILLLELRSAILDINKGNPILNNDSNLAVMYSLVGKELVIDDIVLLIDNEIDNRVDNLFKEEVSFYKSFFMLELERLSQDDDVTFNGFYRKRIAQYTYLDLDLRLSLHKVKLKTMMK